MASVDVNSMHDVTIIDRVTLARTAKQVKSAVEEERQEDCNIKSRPT